MMDYFTETVDTYIEGWEQIRWSFIKEVKREESFVRMQFHQEIAGAKRGYFLKDSGSIREIEDAAPHWVFMFVRNDELKQYVGQHGYSYKFSDELMRLDNIPEFRTSPLVLRVANVEEAELLNHFYQKEIVDPLSIDRIPVFYYHAEKPFSYGKVVMAGQFACLHGVFTHPDYRGRGAAKEVCMKMLDEMKNEGAVGSVLVATDMAFSLYQSLGFKKVGRLLIFEKNIPSFT